MTCKCCLSKSCFNDTGITVAKMRTRQNENETKWERDKCYNPI